MKPILFELGSIKIYTISLFLSLAFLLGTFLVWREGRKKGFEEEKVLDLVIFSVLGGIILGRLTFILLNLELFESFLDYFMFWKVSGISFYAAVFGVFGIALFLTRRNHWPINLILDLLMMGFYLALPIYKLGLFLSGGGFGAATKFFLGISFLGIPEKRHPISLYEFILFAGAFLVFYYLWSKGKIKGGRFFGWGLFLIGAFELLLYFFSDKLLFANATLTLIARFSIMLLGFLSLYFLSERDIKKDTKKLLTNLGRIFLKKKAEEKNAENESS